MYRIRKEFKWEAAHILNASKTAECRENIHGHSYRAEVFVQRTELNQSGMVVDFGILSEKMKPLLERWDHALFLPLDFDRPAAVEIAKVCKKIVHFPGNPTAEAMAFYIFTHLIETAGTEFGILKVRVHETATGWAEYERER